jgi:hypothetical protein
MLISVSLIISGCKGVCDRKTVGDPRAALGGKVEVCFFGFAPAANRGHVLELAVFNGTDKELWIDVDESRLVLDAENGEKIPLRFFPFAGSYGGYYFHIKPWQNVGTVDFASIRLYCDRVIDFDRSYLIRWKLVLYDGRVLRGTDVIKARNSSK